MAKVKKLDKQSELLVKELFTKWSGEEPNYQIKLPQSGSNREYFRLSNKKVSVLGVYNEDYKENLAFVEFSKHFIKRGLPVPDVVKEDLKRNIYLVDDLGDVTLFSLLEEMRKEAGGFPDAIKPFYRKVVQALPRIQLDGNRGLDYSLCYPIDVFDKQSVQWDLNYFKYYFVKFANIGFDEQLLENDFKLFSEFLLEADSEYFMFRDFQSRNIMLVDDEPYFIDYQGGRKGAAQYDIASLLFDAKADIPFEFREELKDLYYKSLNEMRPQSKAKFDKFYPAFVLVRIMQAMGAYGFRGLFEKKDHFIKSIPFGLKNLSWVLKNYTLEVKLPELTRVLNEIVNSQYLNEIGKEEKLKVYVTSFSYKYGIPEDDSSHRGGFVFDCRSLPNPGREKKYKMLTGKDSKVQEFLKEKVEFMDFVRNTTAIVNNAIDNYLARNFKHLFVCYGCTGGQHRSVYSAECLAKELSNNGNIEVQLKHREFPHLNNLGLE